MYITSLILFAVLDLKMDARFSISSSLHKNTSTKSDRALAEFINLSVRHLSLLICSNKSEACMQVIKSKLEGVVSPPRDTAVKNACPTSTSSVFDVFASISIGSRR